MLSIVIDKLVSDQCKPNPGKLRVVVLARSYTYLHGKVVVVLTESVAFVTTKMIYGLLNV